MITTITKLKLSRRMKELGFPPSRHFNWQSNGINSAILTMNHSLRSQFYSDKLFENLMSTCDCKTYYPAYLLEELTEFIKDRILCYEFLCDENLMWRAQTKTRECDCKRCEEGLKEDPDYLAVNWDIAEDKSLVNCAAKLCIELAEKGILNP
jgi:hypothetical protein